MKKHPIDDLFARKLSDWEPKVSPDLWDRIEVTQKKSSRKVVWGYWYAAASLVLVMLTGYLVWKGESETFTPTNETIATRDSGQVTPQRGKSFQIVEPEQVLVAAEAKATNKVVERKVPTSKVIDLDATAAQKDGEYLATIEIQDLQPVEKEKYSPQTLEKVRDNLPVVVPPEIALGASEEPKSNDRVIVAHIPLQESGLQEENVKSSKFIKVLRQLKNAKEGEAVDWNEVGFNPKKLIARADERLRNEEEKVSKYYQNLKEKTKL